jgi:hypothetical protein
MPPKRPLLTIAIVACAASTLTAASPKARVFLEVRTRPGVPLGASQEWSKTLAELKLAGVQIHSGTAGDEVGITEQGSATSPAYRVVGILGPDNRLYLPGGKFAVNDIGGLRKWIANLDDQGVQAVTQPRQAFGLTANNLDAVLTDLKKPVASTLKGQTALRAVRQIAGQLKFPIETDPQAERELGRSKVEDDLTGLSCGTALAAVGRPSGLGVYPRAEAGRIKYRIEPAHAGRDAWPVGRMTKERPDKVLAELFEFVNVEVKDITVAEALEGIQGRLRVPFLVDHNALALHGIDPAKTPANVPEKRMTYSQALNKVLQQAKLKYELRVDEADRPFVWITSVRPAQ